MVLSFSFAQLQMKINKAFQIRWVKSIENLLWSQKGIKQIITSEETNIIIWDSLAKFLSHNLNFEEETKISVINILTHIYTSSLSSEISPEFLSKMNNWLFNLIISDKSNEMRKKMLQDLPFNPDFLSTILSRIKDVNPMIRKVAYEKLTLNKVWLDEIPINQRKQILLLLFKEDNTDIKPAALACLKSILKNVMVRYI